jgi:hypothetical protein
MATARWKAASWAAVSSPAGPSVDPSFKHFPAIILIRLSGFSTGRCLYHMKKLSLLPLFFLVMAAPVQSPAQKSAGWKVEKMPTDLETKFALSSLPGHVRDNATVYLLDPEKGFYVARQGSNGYSCFVLRTDWQLGEFPQDLAAAISYDAEGTKAIFPVYADVEAMRASGNFTAVQVKDSIAARFKRGYYRAPSKPGLSYMLAPVMRVYTKPGDPNSLATFSMPHYMFYAPYFTAADIGGNSTSNGPTVLGDGSDPHTYIILPAGEMEKAKIMDENQNLYKQLVAYRSYFAVKQDMVHH